MFLFAHIDSITLPLEDPILKFLLILVIIATFHPLTMGGITLTDILVVVLSSLLLFMAAFTFRSKKLDRWEGAIFLAIYIAYIWYLVRYRPSSRGRA